MTSHPWLLYGANGYTGELIAREAVRRGMRPVLAGRNKEVIEKLASELGCEARVFDLNKPDLSNVKLVLHCAGPFVHTSPIMVNACLATGAHYLDITGEMAVFEAVLAPPKADAARRAGIALLPGVGFDVVPSDSLAARLAAALPGATELTLAFAADGGAWSRGTAKTMIENLQDVWAARKGLRPPDQVRRATVSDALVDTGATLLSLPTSLIRQLGLEPFSTTRVRSSAPEPK